MVGVIGVVGGVLKVRFSSDEGRRGVAMSTRKAIRLGSFLLFGFEVVVSFVLALGF